MFRTRSRIHTALPSTCQVCIPHKHAQAAACTDNLESCWECGQHKITVYEIRIYKSKYASTYLNSNVWYIISYLFYNALTIVLYLSKSFKIYSNNLGAHWISMVSSYQWWSAKIPRKKSKRPIAMQPCPKSDQDSIPQPVKSLVFLMQWTSWPKGSGNDILLVICLIRSAATCFVNFFHVRLSWSDEMSSNTVYDSKLIAMDKATSLLPCPSPLANWSQLLLQKVSIHSIHYRSQKEIIWLVRVFLEVIWSAHQPTSQVCLSLFCKLFLAICHCILNAKHLSSLEGKFWMTGGEPGHLKEFIPQPELA